VFLVRWSFHLSVHFVCCRILALSSFLQSCSLAVASGKVRVQFGRESNAVFSGKSSGLWAGCLTQRAPDVWESAAFSGFFLALGFSCFDGLVHARPHAGNANR
jgi:hypothetical protein